MMPSYFIMYCISPYACHRWVGYLEETAVESYSMLIQHVKEGHFTEFATEKAPQEAIEYYELDKDAKILEMLEHIRADEACHMELNHHFADIPDYSKVEFHTTTVDSDTGKILLEKSEQEKLQDSMQAEESENSVTSSESSKR
jgi:ubiquinol oxidase